MRNAVILMTAVLVGFTVLALTACEPAAPPAATGAAGSAGGSDEPPAAPAPAEPRQPAPPSQSSGKTWPVSADHFPDDFGSRSEPFAWDLITADNLDRVRVSIGGKDLPFASSAYQPAFAADVSGAEWRIDAHVRGTCKTLILGRGNETAPGFG